MRHPLDEILDDPLEELYDLFEWDVKQKPPIETDQPSAYGGPNQGEWDHPVSMKRNKVDERIHQGFAPEMAHQDVHGDVDLADVGAKSHLAGTLGRVQDESSKRGVKIEAGKGSILSQEAELEKEMEPVTHNDMSTPMRGQVPDKYQTPGEASAPMGEQLEIEEDYDYNDDVAYLQKYGRA